MPATPGFVLVEPVPSRPFSRQFGSASCFLHPVHASAAVRFGCFPLRSAGSALVTHNAYVIIPRRLGRLVRLCSRRPVARAAAAVGAAAVGCGGAVVHAPGRAAAAAAAAAVAAVGIAWLERRRRPRPPRAQARAQRIVVKLQRKWCHVHDSNLEVVLSQISRHWLHTCDAMSLGSWRPCWTECMLAVYHKQSSCMKMLHDNVSFAGTTVSPCRLHGLPLWPLSCCQAPAARRCRWRPAL